MESTTQTFESVAQVAQRFGVARPTIYLWASKGIIPKPSVKIGSVSGFTDEQVQKIREHVESLRLRLGRKVF